MQITFINNQKQITLEAKNCNLIQKITGLTFTKKEKAKILLFDFKKQTKIPIHSFFVFFNFLAIWLDEDNQVIEIKKVTPWKLSIAPKKSFTKLIEIPINKKHKELLTQLH